MGCSSHLKSMLSLLILLTCALTAYSTRQLQESFLSTSEPLTSRSLENVATTNKVTRNVNTFTIVKTIPRQRRFFTEGLSFKNATTLLESVGNYGGSKIQYIDATDMSVLKQQALNNKYFGEGCAEVNNGYGDIIYQMTWKERKVFVWDANTLKLKNTLEMPKQILEGWGMAKRPERDAKGNIVTRLYVSDGSSNIHVVDPKGFTVLRSFKVFTSDNTAVTMLNELEFVKGRLWANIWTTSKVAVIDPATGFVEAMIDFSLLTTKAYQKAREFGLSWNGDSVLNGIAYYPATEILLLTGKMWPMMFQIKVEGL